MASSIELSKFLELARKVTFTREPTLFEGQTSAQVRQLRKRFYRLRDSIPLTHPAHPAVQALTFRLVGRTLTVATKLDWTKLEAINILETHDALDEKRITPAEHR